MSKNVRKLPRWMHGKKGAVKDAINNIVTNENQAVNEDDGPTTTKRRLRSNFQFEENEEELERLAPNFNVDDLPMVSYDGKIKYLSDFYDIAEACDFLVQKIEKVEGEEPVPVSFDMEWTFNFQTGPERTSLIQICIDLDECFLFHLPQLKKLPASLTALLNHPRAVLHGVNIKNDLRKLERDFPIIKADPMIEKCKDLGVWYNDIFNSSGRWSMERLVLQTLRLRVDKSRQVRMSKWHIFPLSENQQTYAAIDVYVSKYSTKNPLNLNPQAADCTTTLRA
jgi:werner syndrome-like exonuclease